MATGINNAAHIGGMIMGALLAILVYQPKDTSSKSRHSSWIDHQACCVPYFINAVSV
jgi:membrane associated rhomboid family serine protease